MLRLFQVILTARLREAINRLNPGIPAAAREDALKQILDLGTPALLSANRHFHRPLVGGVPVQYQLHGETRGDLVRLIDWANPERNDWLAVNQFSIKGSHHTRRPDIILFVNGLPLVLIELKNPADLNADVGRAYDQIQTYKEQIPDVFQYNEVLVITDGTEALLGSLSSDAERFMAWRTIDGITLDPLGEFNELQTLVRGVLAPEYLLDFLRYFVLFEDDGGLIKKIAGYHQFHAVRLAIGGHTPHAQGVEVAAAVVGQGRPGLNLAQGQLPVDAKLGKTAVPDFIAVFNINFAVGIERLLEQRGELAHIVVVGTHRNVDPDVLFGLVGQGNDVLPGHASGRCVMRAFGGPVRPGRHRVGIVAWAHHLQVFQTAVGVGECQHHVFAGRAPQHVCRGAIFCRVMAQIAQLRQAELALEAARRRELETGNQIQQALLAGHPTHITPDLWMSFYNQASQGIDGDFVDVIQIGEHCTDIIAGDVMGKGVPAALMGAATKLQFSRSIAELLAHGGGLMEPPQPSAIMASVHRAMTPHLQQLDSFVTLSYVCIDTRRNLMTWVGCGHKEPLLVGQRGRTQLPGNQHPPLGVLDSDEFTQDQAALAPGETVFLCSDGLTDAIRPDGGRVGRERVNHCMQQLLSGGASPAAALHSLRKQLLHPAIKVVDDVTLVLVARPDASIAQARLELPISLDSIRSMREFVSEQIRHAKLPEQEADLFLLACVEVFTNIVRHGQGLLADAPLELVTQQLADEFVIKLIHLGQAFTPPPEVPDTGFDSFPEGGFGLAIIRNACDRVAYLHQDGVNTVRLGRWRDT